VLLMTVASMRESVIYKSLQIKVGGDGFSDVAFARQAMLFFRIVISP
jgi:hypothetical protein